MSHWKCEVWALSLHCPKPILVSLSMDGKFRSGNPPGNFGYILKHQESKAVGDIQCGPPAARTQPIWPVSSPRKPWLAVDVPGVPTERMDTAPHALALAGRECLEDPGLAIGVTWFIIIWFVITRWHSRPCRLAGHPPAFQLLWLPPGFCCFCLDSKLLREPLFFTLFKVPKLLGAWAFHTPGSNPACASFELRLLRQVACPLWIPLFLSIKGQPRWAKCWFAINISACVAI